MDDVSRGAQGGFAYVFKSVAEVFEERHRGEREKSENACKSKSGGGRGRRRDGGGGECPEGELTHEKSNYSGVGSWLEGEVRYVKEREV